MADLKQAMVPSEEMFRGMSPEQVQGMMGQGVATVNAETARMNAKTNQVNAETQQGLLGNAQVRTKLEAFNVYTANKIATRKTDLMAEQVELEKGKASYYKSTGDLHSVQAKQVQATIDENESKLKLIDAMSGTVNIGQMKDVNIGLVMRSPELMRLAQSAWAAGAGSGVDVKIGDTRLPFKDLTSEMKNMIVYKASGMNEHEAMFWAKMSSLKTKGDIKQYLLGQYTIKGITPTNQDIKMIDQQSTEIFTNNMEIMSKALNGDKVKSPIPIDKDGAVTPVLPKIDLGNLSDLVNEETK